MSLPYIVPTADKHSENITDYADVVTILAENRKGVFVHMEAKNHKKS